MLPLIGLLVLVNRDRTSRIVRGERRMRQVAGERARRTRSPQLVALCCSQIRR
jgi:hypothetical protein